VPGIPAGDVPVQDNGFAISVPVEHQTPGGDISKLVSNHPNLRIFRCDGTDFVASYATVAEAVNYCRGEGKPALIHAYCTRPYSHSLSDDEKLYRPRRSAPRKRATIRWPRSPIS